MEVTNEQYLLFHDMLFKKFKAHVDFLFLESGQDPNTAPCKLWEYLNFQVLTQKGKVFLSVVLFNASPGYFYKLKPKVGRKGNVSIHNIRLVKALEFVLVTPKENLFNGGNWLTRAEELWEVYQENFTKKNQTKVLTSETKVDAIEATRNTILRFYESLMEKQYSDAWNCLSDQYRQRSPWYNNFSKFEEGYSTTCSLQNLSVFNQQERGCYVSNKLYYEDKVRVYPIRGLAGFEDLTVEEVAEQIKKLAIIKSEVETRGGQNFGRTRVKDLFKPTASTILLYTCDVPPDIVHKTFPRPKIISVSRLLDITCVRVGSNWYIHDLHHIQVVAI